MGLVVREMEMFGLPGLSLGGQCCHSMRRNNQILPRAYEGVSMTTVHDFKHNSNSSLYSDMALNSKP